MNLNTRTEGGSNGIKLLQCGQVIGSSELRKKKSAEQTFLQSFYLGPYAEHNGKECLPCRPGISIQERLGPERANRSLLK